VINPEGESVPAKTLTSKAGLGDIATYNYDERGNVTHREIRGESWDFVYDGGGEMREAVKTAGDATGAREVHFYDHAGQRMLAFRSAFEQEEARGRFWFGATEVTYRHSDGDWSTMKPAETVVHTALGGMPIARIVNNDPSTLELTYMLNVSVRRAAYFVSVRRAAYFCRGPSRSIVGSKRRLDGTSKRGRVGEARRALEEERADVEGVRGGNGNQRVDAVVLEMETGERSWQTRAAQAAG